MIFSGIRSRLFLILLLPAIAIFVTTGFVLIQLEDVVKEAEAILNQNTPIVQATRAAEQVLNNADGTVNFALLSQKKQALDINLKRINQASDVLDESSKSFEAITNGMILGSESDEFKALNNGEYYEEWSTGVMQGTTVPAADLNQKKLLESASTHYDEYVSAALTALSEQRDLVSRLQKDDNERAEIIRSRMEITLDNLKDARDGVNENMNELLVYNWDKTNKRTATLSESVELLRSTLAIPLVAVVGAIFIGLIIVQFSLVRPIVQLTAIASEVSKGNFNITLIPSKKKDEISKLYRAFDRMIVSLKLAMRVNDAPSTSAKSGTQGLPSISEMDGGIQSGSSMPNEFN